MNLKKILAITLLMTIFMVGTVSASDVDTNIVWNSESHNTLKIPKAEDFNFVIAEEASIKNKDAVVLSFDWPECTIEPDVVTIRRNGIDVDQRGKYKKSSEKFTLNDLLITEPGTYSFNIWFGDDNFIRTFTIKVTENDPTTNSNQQDKTQPATTDNTVKSTNNAVQLTLKKITVKKSAKQLVLTGTLKKGKTALKTNGLLLNLMVKNTKLKPIIKV